MDRSAVKAIVDRELEPLMDAMGVGHWLCEVKYGPCDGGSATAECRTSIDYDRVHINLDPEGHDDEADVIEALEHELAHVVVSPYDLLYQVAIEHVPDDSPARGVIERIRRHCDEQAVRGIERLMDAQKELRGEIGADGPPA